MRFRHNAGAAGRAPEDRRLGGAPGVTAAAAGRRLLGREDRHAQRGGGARARKRHHRRQHVGHGQAQIRCVARRAPARRQARRVGVRFRP